MKQAFVQVAARTTAGTQDITDSTAGFSSDVKAVLLWLTTATAVDTSTSDAMMSFGMTDGTSTYNWTHHATTGSSNSDAYCTSTTNILGFTASAGGTYTANATVNSILSNGIRISWGTAPGSAYLINALILGGSDVKANVVTGSFTNTSAGSSVAVSHNLGVTPNLFFGANHNYLSGTGAVIGSFDFGFSDGTNYASVAVCTNIGASWTQTGVYNTYISQNVNGALKFGVTLDTIGASSFNMTSSAGVLTNPTTMAWLVLNVTGSVSVGTILPPTSNADQVIVSGMANAPTSLLIASSLRNGVNTNAQVQSCLGLFAAVNNNGTTQQGGAAHGQQSGSATPASGSRSTNTHATAAVSTNGSIVNSATLKTWNSDGVTLTWDATTPTAYRIAYVAFGPASSVTSAAIAWTHY